MSGRGKKEEKKYQLSDILKYSLTMSFVGCNTLCSIRRLHGYTGGTGIREGVYILFFLLMKINLKGCHIIIMVYICH